MNAGRAEDRLTISAGWWVEGWMAASRTPATFRLVRLLAARVRSPRSPACSRATRSRRSRRPPRSGQRRSAPPSRKATTTSRTDLAQRDVDAKEVLGEGARTEVVSDVFLVAGEAGYDDFASGVSLTRRAMDAYFNGRFDKRPTQAITVFLFGGETPYEAFCVAHEGHACITPYGFFDGEHRRMVMNAGLGLGTLTHELVHPLVDADFPGAPTWIDEGIASLSKAPRSSRRRARSTARRTGAGHRCARPSSRRRRTTPRSIDSSA